MEKVPYCNDKIMAVLHVVKDALDDTRPDYGRARAAIKDALEAAKLEAKWCYNSDPMLKEQISLLDNLHESLIIAEQADLPQIAKTLGKIVDASVAQLEKLDYNGTYSEPG